MLRHVMTMPVIALLVFEIKLSVAVLLLSAELLTLYYALFIMVFEL